MKLMGIPLERGTLMLTTSAAMCVATAALTWRLSTVNTSIVLHGAQLELLRAEMTGSSTIQQTQIQALRTETGVQMESVFREIDRLRADVTGVRNELSSALARLPNGNQR